MGMGKEKRYRNGIWHNGMRMEQWQAQWNENGTMAQWYENGTMAQW